jgi:hypothetical protein
VSTAPEPAPGRLTRLGVVARSSDPDENRRLARMSDLAGIDVVWVADEQVADELREWVARAEVRVRPDADEPWARTLPVSLGRTPAEALARLELDPEMGGYGDPREIGLFGTLEEGQQRVIELAHAGVRDLRCVLPDAPDIHDLVAQLTAVVVGSLDTHQPGAARSADPEPPPWAAPR